MRLVLCLIIANILVACGTSESSHQNDFTSSVGGVKSEEIGTLVSLGIKYGVPETGIDLGAKATQKFKAKGKIDWKITGPTSEKPASIYLEGTNFLLPDAKLSCSVTLSLSSEGMGNLGIFALGSGTEISAEQLEELSNTINYADTVAAFAILNQMNDKNVTLMDVQTYCKNLRDHPMMQAEFQRHLDNSGWYFFAKLVGNGQGKYIAIDGPSDIFCNFDGLNQAKKILEIKLNVFSDRTRINYKIDNWWIFDNHSTSHTISNFDLHGYKDEIETSLISGKMDSAIALQLIGNFLIGKTNNLNHTLISCHLNAID